MKIKIIPDARTLKTAGRVAGFVGAGAVASQLSSNALQNALPSVGGFAARGPYHRAAVDVGVGLVAAGVAHIVLTKLKIGGASKAGALLATGAIIAAAAPIVRDQVMPALSGMLPMAKPAGYLRPAAPGVVMDMVPGAFENVAKPAGVAMGDVPFID